MKDTLRRWSTVVLLSWTMFGCANQAPETARTYRIGEKIVHAGYEVSVRSAIVSRELRYGNRPSPMTKQSSGRFVIAEVAVMNVTDRPAPMQLQPSYALVDANGVLFSESMENAIFANAPGTSLNEPLNPRLGRLRKVAVEVPPGSYRLRVLIPEGYYGNRSFGSTFLVELPEVR